MGLFKVRVSKKGSGKSSSFRTIVVYRKDDRVLFVYGFSKNKKENLTRDELIYFKEYAKEILHLSDEEIEFAIKDDKFIELGENHER